MRWKSCTELSRRRKSRYTSDPFSNRKQHHHFWSRQQRRWNLCLYWLWSSAQMHLWISCSWHWRIPGRSWWTSSTHPRSWTWSGRTRSSWRWPMLSLLALRSSNRLSFEGRNASSIQFQTFRSSSKRLPQIRSLIIRATLIADVCR